MRRPALPFKEIWLCHMFNPLCFTVGLRATDADKFLADTVLSASFAESMIVNSSFKFRTNVLNR